MKKLLLLFTLVIAINVDAVNVKNGPRRAIENGTTGHFFLYHSGTPTANANNGDYAVVGGNYYEAVKTKSFTPVSSSDGNFNTKNFDDEHKDEHKGEVNQNEYVKLAVNPTYWQRSQSYVVIAEPDQNVINNAQKKNNTDLNPYYNPPYIKISDGEGGYTYYEFTTSWAVYSGTPSGNSISYVDDDTDKSGWNTDYVGVASSWAYYKVEEVLAWDGPLTYDDGKQASVYYNDISALLETTPTSESQKAVVGGTLYHAENQQWVADVPDVPTSWESPVLTMGTTEERTISQVMSSYNITASDVSTVNGLGYTYDKTTGKLTMTSSSVDYNVIKQQLEDAGFEVDVIQLGEYVRIEGDVVVVNTKNETGVITSNINGQNKLSGPEREALRNATKLKVEGTVTADDWTGLSNAAGQNAEDGLTHLDLSDAIIPADAKLTNKFKYISYIDLPTDPNYTTIPESFAENSNLLEITFPDQITTIGAKAFKGCDLLETVHIDSSIHSIGNEAFMSCDNLTLVEFANGITNLTFGSSIFEECKRMKHCILPEGLTTIGVNMFQNCHMLESVRLPNTLTTIPNGSFENCISMTTLVIPVGVQTIGQKAFNNSGIQDLYLTQTDPCSLPTIVPDTQGGNSNSTFGIYALNGNNTLMQNADGEVIANMTSEEAAEYFRSVVLGINNIIELHYPTQYSSNQGNGLDPMTAFLDGNPWYQDEELQDCLDNNDKAHAAELIYGVGNEGWRGTYNDGDNWKTVVQNLLNAQKLSDFYAFVDHDGLHWPSHNLFEAELRRRMGLMSDELNSSTLDLVSSCNNGEDDTNGSKLAWRQFVWMHGYAPHEEVYKNEYDDTWYTICFPFDCSDEQLEAAFNSNFNICEFSGVAVEIDEQEATADYTPVDRLLFLFTNIGKTYYMYTYNDKDYYFERKKVLTNTSVGGQNAQVEEKWYHPAKMVKVEGHDQLQRIEPGDSDWPPFWPETGNTLEADASTGWVNKTWLYAEAQNSLANINLLKVAYNKIDGKLARAFHPYMLHPQHVETPAGGRSTCYIPDIEYKIPFIDSQGNLLEGKLAENRAQYESDEHTVTRRLSTIQDNPTQYIADADYINLNTGTVYLEPYQGGNLKYKFQGTPAPNTKDETTGKVNSGDLIPDGAYFLAVKAGEKYPKYYRRDTSKNNGGGFWMQYTAIIQPNAAAKAWEDSHDEIRVANAANGFSLALGEFEEVTTDEIEEIINEAKAEDKPIRRFDVVVNVNGQVVREGTSLLGLPKGIYIVNGKKYLVR